MERHPESFEEAKSYEKNAIEHGSPFTWSQGESLEDLARPERVEQIREEHRKRLERAKAISDLFVDRLLQEASSIRLRYSEISKRDAAILKEVAGVLEGLTGDEIVAADCRRGPAT